MQLDVNLVFHVQVLGLEIAVAFCTSTTVTAQGIDLEVIGIYYLHSVITISMRDSVHFICTNSKV